MRCYSEHEVREIIVQKPELAFDAEKPTREPDDTFDFIQFIADLEFEMKFETLLRSIAMRLPCF